MGNLFFPLAIVLNFILLYSSTIVHALSTSSPKNLNPLPIDGSKWPDKFPAKNHCSRCGLCETTFVSKVKESCAFLGEGMKRMDSMESKVHGRHRNLDLTWSDDGANDENDENVHKISNDEGRFGVMERPMMLGKGVGIPHAQWTGCITGIAISMLESGMVDAVVCIASKSENEKAKANENDGLEGKGKGKENESNYSWSEPEPILARTVEQVLRGRGVKPALAPSLKVLDEIKNDETVQKLLFCGVGCAVQGEFTF